MLTIWTSVQTFKTGGSGGPRLRRCGEAEEYMGDRVSERLLSEEFET
jgi:hypothetical protein